MDKQRLQMYVGRYDKRVLWLRHVAITKHKVGFCWKIENKLCLSETSKDKRHILVRFSIIALFYLKRLLAWGTKESQSRFRFTKKCKVKNTYKWVSVIVFDLSSSSSEDLLPVITDLFWYLWWMRKRAKSCFKCKE